MGEYFRYLMSIVSTEYAGRSYERLMQALFCENFQGDFKNDVNRAYDGQHLREGHMPKGVKTNAPCSFLELLIGLAHRIDFQIADASIDVDNRRMIFWRLISNLELDRLDDKHFDPHKVEEVVKRVNDRSYRADGHGGIFPLKYPSKDQREVEIWYQMHEWIGENFV